jgi:isopenicillin N synthase-like dioxygenase
MSGRSKNAVSSDSLEIPLIDFDGFASGDEGTKRTTAHEILNGFVNAGFIYLTNHPIPRSTVQRTFELSKAFFQRSQKQKNDLAWTTPEANRGYSGQGREKTSNSYDYDEIAQEREEAGADLKESFEIGREGEEGLPNHWPDRFDSDGTAFKEQMVDFFEQCKEVHMQIMQAIAVGLGIDGTWFDSYCDGGDNTLRLLHYPEVGAEVFKKNKNQVRAGAHSDYGSITLVCLTDLRLWLCHSLFPAFPGYERRASGPISQWQLHRRNADRRHHCSQCRRFAGSMVERHNQKHQASSGGASNTR